MSLLVQSVIYFAAMGFWAVVGGLATLPPAIHYGVFGVIVGWYWFTPTVPTPTKQAQGEAA